MTIAERLRDYAAQIELGVIAPTKMVLFLDNPSIVGMEGEGVTPALIDRMRVVWAAGAEADEGYRT